LVKIAISLIEGSRQPFSMAGYLCAFFKVRCMRLMTAILLGMARGDAFNANAQSQPPHRQLAQVK